MARLGDRIARLEASARAAGHTEEAKRWAEEVEQVARGLGTDDLRAVVAVLDDALGALPDGAIREEEAEASGAAGPGGDLSDALRALREVADERGRRALDAALEVLAALRRGGHAGEQQQPPKGEPRP